MGEESISVGRSKACHIVVADPSVSRRHAELVVGREGRLFVTDCQSKHGTFVTRAGMRRRIRQGTVDSDSIVAFGDFEFDARTLLDLVAANGRGGTTAPADASGAPEWVLCPRCRTPQPRAELCREPDCRAALGRPRP